MTYMIGPAEIFTLFFVTLGPLKILGPFAQRTHDLDPAAMRKVALWAFVIATIAIVAGSVAGSALAANWHIEISALMIAAGLIFLLVALNQLLQQYEPPHAPVAPPPLPPTPMSAAVKLLFPVVLTPYGIAAVIVLLARSQGEQRDVMILGLVVGVMVLNLLAMLFARKILTGITMIVLQVVGAVLGVLQAGLAVEFILAGLRGLGVLGK
ncbi:MAG TPA: MarC family protein [Casimicrobiaceae bacterium]|nr:MarC family protein [Casimicrobiaceae bacterium]